MIPILPTITSRARNCEASNIAKKHHHVHQSVLSQLNLDVYTSIKNSLVIQEHHQRVSELKHLLDQKNNKAAYASDDSLGTRNENNSNNPTAQLVARQQKKILQKQQLQRDGNRSSQSNHNLHNNNNNSNKNDGRNNNNNNNRHSEGDDSGNNNNFSFKTNNAGRKSAQAEVQSLRREQNETIARREQLKVWVEWLRQAVKTFASPAAAVEAFVTRTHELCQVGVSSRDSVVPDDFNNVVENYVFQQMRDDGLIRGASSVSAFASPTSNSNNNNGFGGGSSRKASFAMMSGGGNNNNNEASPLAPSLGSMKSLQASTAKVFANLDAAEKHHHQLLRGSSSFVNNNNNNNNNNKAEIVSPLPPPSTSPSPFSQAKSAFRKKSGKEHEKEKLSQIEHQTRQQQNNTNNSGLIRGVDFLAEDENNNNLQHHDEDDNDNDDDSGIDSQRKSNNNNKSVKCEILATLASLAALLTLAEVWNENESSKDSLLPPISTSSSSSTPKNRNSRHHFQQGIISSSHEEQHADTARQHQLRLLIRSIVDDLASGIFFSPPSMGCSSPEDVAENLGGARAFSDVFNDMLSVAVFHRDRADMCRYLEVRREKVLNRCIDNFRREHCRASLRVWKFYTIQRRLQRRRTWEKLLRQRDNQAVRTAIGVWKQFATHVHLANMMTANRRIEQVMDEIRRDHKGHLERIRILEEDRSFRQRDKEEAQEKFDVVEVRNSHSRERFVAVSKEYLDVRRKWVEVVRMLFNDDESVKDLSDSESSSFSSNNYYSKSSAMVIVPPPTSITSPPTSPALSSGNRNITTTTTMTTTWSAAVKAINWAKWLLSIYSPADLKEWERETGNRKRLQRAGRYADVRNSTADLDDRYGNIPYVSLTAVRGLMAVLVNLHLKNRNNQIPNNNNININNPSTMSTNNAEIVKKNISSLLGYDDDLSVATKVVKHVNNGQNAETRNFTSESRSTNTTRTKIADDIWNLYNQLNRLSLSNSNNNDNDEDDEEESKKDGRTLAEFEATSPSGSFNNDKKNVGEPPSGSTSKSRSRKRSASVVDDNSGNTIPSTASAQEALALSPSLSGDYSNANINNNKRQQNSTAAPSPEPEKVVGTKSQINYNNNNNAATPSVVVPSSPTAPRQFLPWRLPVPPVSLADLIREDQLRLVILVLHLAHIWAGGFAGSFFEKERGDAHDRNAQVAQSRLVVEPKQGKMALVEETEEMVADWTQGLQKLSSLKESTLFEVGFEEGLRDCIENGEAQLFRQTLQNLFNLMTLGDTISKQGMEQLLMSLRSDTCRGTLDSFESQETQQATSAGNNLNNNNNNNNGNKRQKSKMNTNNNNSNIPAKWSNNSTSTKNAKSSNQRNNNNSSGSTTVVTDVKLSFPPWPQMGISSVSDLGLYLTDAALVLGYHRRILAEELSTLLLQSSNIAFSHSVFVPSEVLKLELASRASDLGRVFHEFAIVSRTKDQAYPGASRSANNNNNNTTTATMLVFSKKSYFKWLDDVVSKHYPDHCPIGEDAESLFTNSQNFAPERDSVLLEMLVCATAAFIYPNPFEQLEEKVKRFCLTVFSSASRY